MPDEALLQLSHRDVNLGYFRYVQGPVRKLISGDELIMQDAMPDGKHNGRQYGTLNAAQDAMPDGMIREAYSGNARPVIRLSRACMEKLEKLRLRGFTIYRIKVRFAVWWKGKEDENETLILLPDIFLRA